MGGNEECEGVLGGSLSLESWSGEKDDTGSLRKHRVLRHTRNVHSQVGRRETQQPEFGRIFRAGCFRDPDDSFNTEFEISPLMYSDVCNLGNDEFRTLVINLKSLFSVSQLLTLCPPTE